MPPTLAEVKLKDPQLTSEERIVLERLIRDRPYVMRLTVITSKKRIHKSAVIRGKFRKRFRAIVRRCVQRGGAVQPDAEKESPKHWLLPGHYYVVHPLKTMLLADEAELSKQVEEALVESKRLGENLRIEEAAVREQDGQADKENQGIPLYTIETHTIDDM